MIFDKKKAALWQLVNSIVRKELFTRDLDPSFLALALFEKK